MAQSEERKNYKAPPAYCDGENYSGWKLDIDLWQEFTSLEKKKQGTAFLLELKPGKVANCHLEPTSTPSHYVNVNV